MLEFLKNYSEFPKTFFFNWFGNESMHFLLQQHWKKNKDPNPAVVHVASSGMTYWWVPFTNSLSPPPLLPFPLVLPLLPSIPISLPVPVSVFFYYIWTLPLSPGTNWLLSKMVGFLTKKNYIYLYSGREIINTVPLQLMWEEIWENFAITPMEIHIPIP